MLQVGQAARGGGWSDEAGPRVLHRRHIGQSLR